MRTKRGMTLIEILVSLGIGMMLVALGTSALLHASKVFARNTAHLQGHDDAAAIQQRLTSTLESLYHPAQMGCRADAGVDGTWGTGDELIEMTWMNSVRALDESTMTYEPKPMHDLLWQRMRWTGDGKGGGSIQFAHSAGRRLKYGGWTYMHGSPAPWSRDPGIAFGPFVRRDRRRDLNDNDLRYLPGMDMATYLAMGENGDSSDLDDRLRPWHPSTTLVSTCIVEWVDQGGNRVRCDPTAGVSIVDRAGNPVSLLGTTYSNQTAHVVDGTWLDGRNHVPADVPPGAPAYYRSITSAQRPSLIRVSFQLIMTTVGDRVRLDKDPRLPFTLTISPAMALPPL
jgi:hypothetical protein